MFLSRESILIIQEQLQINSQGCLSHLIYTGRDNTFLEVWMKQSIFLIASKSCSVQIECIELTLKKLQKLFHLHESTGESHL